MKCQNMRIADILFFITNLITIHSTNVQEDIVSPQSVPLENVLLKRKLDKDCPNLSNIIRENNLTNYTVDCEPLSMRTDVYAEYVRKQACFAVRNILYFICDNKYNVTPDLLKKGTVNNSDSLCPFNFSHIKHIDFKFSDGESLVMKELTSKDHCIQVCVDFSSIRIQCDVLNRLNNYLSQLPLHQNTIPMEVDESKPEHSKFTIQKVESSSVNKNGEIEKQSVKSKTKVAKESQRSNETGLNEETAFDGKGKNVTKPMREPKTEKVITSLPKEDGMPKSDTKISENESLIPADDEFKSPLDDHSDDLTSEDGVGVMADSISDRSDVGKVDKISVSPPSGKGIYPAEGFFQAEDSHFFFYFIMVSSIIVVGYLAFHNKNKILAYALEGSSSRRSRRRPNPARYRKLETNLEEAISSNAVNSAASNVVY